MAYQLAFLPPSLPSENASVNLSHVSPVLSCRLSESASDGTANKHKHALLHPSLPWRTSRSSCHNSHLGYTSLRAHASHSLTPQRRHTTETSLPTSTIRILQRTTLPSLIRASFRRQLSLVVRTVIICSTPPPVFVLTLHYRLPLAQPWQCTYQLLPNIWRVSLCRQQQDADALA
jgi:hypothetical protein